MKLITFTKDSPENYSIGIVLQDMVLDLNLASNNKIPADMLSFIRRSGEFTPLIKELISNRSGNYLFSLKDIKIKSPLLNPPSLKDFFAFEEHAKAGAKRRNEELAKEWYEIPAYYKGNHRQILGQGDEIPWPSYTKKLDFECEIACVIGKKGKNLTPKEAEGYIFGYMIFNDVSARDIQKKEMVLRMGPAKSKDFANVFGPYLVTKDAVNPEHDFSMNVYVNGELWSSGHFKNQFWGFPLLISHISQEETIYPGDILGSGTFYKGCGLDLDKWVQSGDTIELDVPALGRLKNKVGKPVDYKELNYGKKEITI